METSSPTRRRGRPKANETPASREAILGAALRAFATHGYEGMSVRTLARELGVSHNVIPQRFGNKEKLWYTAVDWGFGGLVDEIDAGAAVVNDDVMDTLRGAIARMLTYSAAHPELLGIVNIEGAIDSPRLDYIYETYVGPATAPLTQLVDRLAEAGRIRSVSPLTLYFLIAHGGGAPFTMTPLAHRLDSSDRDDRTIAQEHAHEVAELIVASLQIREPA